MCQIRVIIIIINNMEKPKFDSRIKQKENLQSLSKEALIALIMAPGQKP
jgi:hypothetical protein